MGPTTLSPTARAPDNLCTHRTRTHIRRPSAPSLLPTTHGLPPTPIPTSRSRAYGSTFHCRTGEWCLEHTHGTTHTTCNHVLVRFSTLTPPSVRQRPSTGGPCPHILLRTSPTSRSSMPRPLPINRYPNRSNVSAIPISPYDPPPHSASSTPAQCWRHTRNSRPRALCPSGAWPSAMHCGGGTCSWGS